MPAVSFEQRIAFVDRERLQAHDVARQFLREADQLIAQDRRDEDENEDDDKDKHGRGSAATRQAAEADPFEAAHHGIEEVAERDAGRERRHRRAEDMQQNQNAASAAAQKRI